MPKHNCIPNPDRKWLYYSDMPSKKYKDLQNKTIFACLLIWFGLTNIVKVVEEQREQVPSNVRFFFVHTHLVTLLLIDINGKKLG